MGLLNGKRGLVFGVANRHSIAWHIAEACAQQGAEVGIGYGLDRLERRVRPLADEIGAFCRRCDVTNDEEIDRFFATVESKWTGQLDFVVHSLAFAEREDLSERFVKTRRTGFATALNVSCFSLIALSQRAAPMMGNGGQILSLTYLGGERVIPNYRVMGPAKAALESSIQYLAHDLGPDGIRVNGISAGPIKTLAASGIPGFKSMLKKTAEINPLRRTINGADIAGSALFLLSDLSSGITGEILHVDAGYHILGAHE